MNILTQYGKEIISILVPLITFILNNFFKGSAKVSIGELHQFSFLIEEPLKDSAGEIIKAKQVVNTKSYIIMNEGREAAKKLELIFNYKDMHMNVWPVKPYTESYDYNGRYVVTFEYIAPKENFRCEVLSLNTDLPELLTCRSEQGISKRILLYPQKVFNKYLIWFIQSCIFLGMATFVYIFILLLQWLITKTG
ncbi:MULTISPECIES: hypothetical protein [Pantoea]|uniref:Uncharacterized protein n=1 Tax=Pantoea brenneri TaxID=472694 RepID=A0ABU9MQI3_9GAMM|nr:hypothetical protein [Pantoea sp. 3.5.1]KKD31761.1 hypothetical protein EP46_14150 [Pantoea sp. 3.5.1]